MSNFIAIIDQIREKFNMWLLRELSVNEGVLLSKDEGISRFK